MVRWVFWGACLGVLLARSAAGGETNSLSSVATTNATRLSEVVVMGRQDSLLGVAESASQGTVGAAEIENRPIMRNGEILETVPGVIITQHAGGGKANQYFLRGFNLDHGTDFAIDLDGMPLNLVSHAHGPGYADMNIVIPELVQRMNYEKGPYYVQNGDFSSAGAAHIEFMKTLPTSMTIAEVGMYGYERLVFADSSPISSGNLLYGAEAYHDDGPWDTPDDYQRFNGILTWSQGDAASGYSVTARGYHGKWNSSDQIAATFAQTDFYGTIDPSDGGNSQRYSLQGEWHRADADSATQVMGYGFYYDLDLFSDFTYFLVDTNKGDQFEQADKRLAAGLKANHTIFSQWGERDVENMFGLQAWSDWINNGLYQSANRVRTTKIDSATGDVLYPITRQDRINESSIGLYYQNTVQWSEKFRSVLGVRGDIYYFNVDDPNPSNSGQRVAGVPSPKGSLIFGPWKQTDFYVSGGFGFHSDDARGTTLVINPDGTAASQLGGLYQTWGTEIGVRTLAVSHLQSTLALWFLHSDSELLYEGDTGQTVTTPQPSNRYGIEWANYYTPLPWLTIDLDYADSVAKFTTPDEDGGTYVPEAIQQVLTAGITVASWRGFYASLRLRYFGPRDLISTGTVRSAETLLLNLGVGYQFNKHWSLRADIFNLLNRADHDIDYYYESRVSPNDVAFSQLHFHPVEPIQVRFILTARF